MKIPADIIHRGRVAPIDFEVLFQLADSVQGLQIAQHMFSGKGIIPNDWCLVVLLKDERKLVVAPKAELTCLDLEEVASFHWLRPDLVARLDRWEERAERVLRESKEETKRGECLEKRSGHSRRASKPKYDSEILGIDFGTHNCCCAVFRNGQPMVIPDGEGRRTTPSVVAFEKYGSCLVGTRAQRQAVTNPENTIFSFKRLLGRRFSEVERWVGLLPYFVKAGANGNAVIECQVDGRRTTFNPEEITRILLAKLKADAEAFLGVTVAEAVISVPAYFNEKQRLALKNAADGAGLEVKRLIHSSVATALAYGYDKESDELVTVCDIGAGMLDMAVLELGDGIFEVKSVNGNTMLGGDEWSRALVSHFLSVFISEHSIDLSRDSMALQRLNEEAERAKQALSSAKSYLVDMPFLANSSGEPKHFKRTIERSGFEEACRSLVAGIAGVFKACLRDSGHEASELSKLILVGGMSRVPSILDFVEGVFGAAPFRGINPDESVALGAAIQGGVLSGEIRDVMLLDVLPLTLSVETTGGVTTPMIERNTTIPTKKSQTFTTHQDNQTVVEFSILQGERPMAKDNAVLGSLRLEGIQPTSRGVPKIEVTFDIDANGILNVSAKEHDQGIETHIP